MLKKLTKALIVNGFIVMLLTMLLSTHVFAALGDTIFSFISGQEVSGQGYSGQAVYSTTSVPSVGTVVHLPDSPPYFPVGYYCMNHGYHYDGGDFRVYETGNVDSLGDSVLSFIVGEHKRAIKAHIPGASTGLNRPNDPWVNYVWNLGLGTNTESPDPNTYDGIENKYNAYRQVYNDVVASVNNPLNIVPMDPSGTEVNVAAGGVLIADDTGRVKFKIEYPWNEHLNKYYGSFRGHSPTGLLDLVDISINMNGTTLFDSDNTGVANKLQKADGSPFQMGDQEAYISVADVNYGASNTIKLDWNFKYYTTAQYAKLEYVGSGTNTPYQDVLYLENSMVDKPLDKEVTVIIGQPNFKLTFDKIDKITTNKLEGVEFEVSVVNGSVVRSDGSLVNPETITTTNADTEIEIKPDNSSGLVNEIIVKFKEKKVPDDKNYLIYRGELEFVVQWNTSTLQWEYKQVNLPTYNSSSENATGIMVDKNSFKLTAANKPIPNIKLLLNKVDSLTGNLLEGATFEIEVENGTLVGSSSITTNSSAPTEIEIKPNKDTGSGNVPDIIVKLKEIDVTGSTSYLIYRSNIEITFSWNPDTCNWEKTAMTIPSYNGVDEKIDINMTGDNKFELRAENRAIPSIKILLNKIDALTGNPLAGVTFEVEVTNGTVVGGSSVTTGSSPTEIQIRPDKDTGDGSVPQITVKLKEVSLAVPNSYLMYRGDIELTFEWEASTSDWIQKTLIFPEYENGVKEKVEINKDGTTICLYTLTVENRPNIQELSGHVWIDVPQGNKHIDPPNGIYDMSEQLKEGIEVSLYDADTGTQITMDGYGHVFGVNGVLTTDASGSYKFENIPKSLGSGYYIVFKYDGINYIRTVDGESKASEANRPGFNSRFKTISAGQSNDGTVLNYNYDGTSKSTLITEDSSGKVLKDFEIDADTKTAGNVYNQPANDIDLGLRPKELDLALMTDLSKAIVSINGLAPVDYDYNTIFNTNMAGILNISQDKTADGVNYNLKIYRSDYNYRIGNYLGTDTSISHQPSLSADEVTALQDSRSELEVKLEYVVVLNNQSGVEATVDNFVFVYDSHLAYDSITGGTATDDGSKLIVTPDNPTLGYAGQTKIVITFKYKLDSASLDSNPTIINRAEILQYSTTEGGYVDCDSAPGNAFDASGFKYEDDSDEAKGLTINATRTEREITGYVFEDKKLDGHQESGVVAGNGELDAGETKVDDVIVQLIEIKNLTVGGSLVRLEYIWQETTSGSNTVRAISSDGTKIEPYNVTPETGKFTFREFIPGEYIVRFIYGDGTYYDQAINGNNILTYNGQDYKSTIDKKYNKKWLTFADYSTNSSMARDNEARRLEVMAYALGVSDINDLTIDSKAKLADTWMAAETSRIVVDDIIVAPGTSEYTAQVNFGLVKRPEVSLALRKHITYASLKNSDGLNAEASVDINAYLDDSTDIYGFNASNSGSTPITAQATTRSNRGYWQVETNRINGANLKLTYTYRVKNSGEIDYLATDLVNKFSLSGAGIETDTQNYINAIKDRVTQVKNEVKTDKYAIIDPTGKVISYLGRAYYEGVKGAEDSEVGAYVHLEDYLKTGFVVDTSNSDLEEVSTSTSKDVISISGTPSQENVKVLQTKNGKMIGTGGDATFKLAITKNGLTAADASSLETLSYIGQVISPTTNLAGTKIKGTTPNNLQYVQSYADMATLDNLNAEEDEYWAETFRVIPTTGGDKFTIPVIILSITSGLAVVVVGIVLIKKFIIK